MTTDTETRVCSLHLALGRKEACPEEGCPFWEPGGMVLDGRCVFEHLDLAGRTSLAQLLLELRQRLESANDAEKARAELARFHRVLSEGRE